MSEVTEWIDDDTVKVDGVLYLSLHGLIRIYGQDCQALTACMFQEVRRVERKTRLLGAELKSNLTNLWYHAADVADYIERYQADQAVAELHRVFRD